MLWNLACSLVIILTIRCRAWKAKQKERIKARDDASELKRQETIKKAEEAIDSFYAEYNAKKEKNIAENKFVAIF